MLNRQEVFNLNWQRFFVEMAPRCVEAYTNHCRYRLDGTPECPDRCGVGLWLTDEDYSEGLEGGTS